MVNKPDVPDTRGLELAYFNYGMYTEVYIVLQTSSC